MTDRNDTNPNLTPDLASLDAALSDLGRRERDATPDALASRTVLKTNALIASRVDAPAPLPMSSIESKWRPLVRIAAGVLLLGAVGFVAMRGFNTVAQPGLDSAELNTIAVAFDDWMDSGELFSDSGLAGELDALELELSELELSDEVAFDFAAEDFAL